jgi:hypothetical protein
VAPVRRFRVPRSVPRRGGRLEQYSCSNASVQFKVVLGCKALFEKSLMPRPLSCVASFEVASITYMFDVHVDLYVTSFRF